MPGKPILVARGSEGKGQDLREVKDREQHNGASVDSEINYYKILQVDVSAEPEMNTAAYWLLVSKYHPAVYKGSDSSLRMRELDQAYAGFK